MKYVKKNFADLLKKLDFKMNEINDRKSIVIKAHTFNSGPKDKEGAVLLIRNPFDAALAEFNRAGHGHTGHASTKAFKSEKWVSHCSKI